MQSTGRLATVIPTALFYATALRSLSALLRTPLSGAECRDLARRRLETREPRFLDSMRRLVYAVPTSPYLALLKLAGCEYRDLELMVNQRGLEPTLEALYQDGVYLSFEEFTVATEATRGAHAVRFDFRDLDNPLLGGHLGDRTSGSRSRGRPVSISFEDIGERYAPTRYLSLEALGFFGGGAGFAGLLVGLHEVGGQSVGGDEAVAGDGEAVPLVVGEAALDVGAGGVVLEQLVFNLGDFERAVGVALEVVTA